MHNAFATTLKNVAAKTICCHGICYLQVCKRPKKSGWRRLYAMSYAAEINKTRKSLVTDREYLAIARVRQ